MSLPEFSVKKPITVLMLLIVIIIFGVIAYIKIPLKMLPDDFSGYFLWINIPYSSSNPNEVLNQIAIPVEDELSTIQGIKTLNSNSSTNGVFFWIEFNQGIDMATAYQEVSDRIERVRPQLPDEVDRIFIRRWNPNDMEILAFAIQPPENSKDTYFLINDVLQPYLQRIDGVAKIDFNGLTEKLIYIEIDAEKLKKHNLNLYQFVSKLRKDNFLMSCGYVIEGGKKNNLIVNARFTNLDEIKNLPIGIKNLKIKDIAKVSYKEPKKTSIFRINGKEGITINIFKESGANTVDVCRKVNKAIAKIFSTDKRFKGFKYFSLWDQGKTIENSLNDLKNSGLIGGLLAMLIVFFFIRRFRLTTVVSLSIPFSLFMAIVWLYFSGGSLNLLSLMGLMLAVGMLVDNSIVVSENIDRLKGMGLGTVEASIKGANEVGLAITLATLTTIVVFLPAMLMGNDQMMKMFMKNVGTTIIYALISSLFVALILIPFTSARVLKQNGKKKTSKFIEKIKEKYKTAISYSLSHKRNLFLIVTLLILSSIYPATHMKKTGNMEGGPRSVRMRVRFPEYYTLEQRDQFFNKLSEKFMKKKKELEIKAITTYISLTWCQFSIWLKDSKDAKKDVADVMKEVKKMLPKVPGIRFRFRGDYSSSKGGTVNIFFYGKDQNTLMQIAEEFKTRVEHLKGVVNVDIDVDERNQQIVATVKRETAQKKGVLPIEVESSISWFLREIPLPKYISKDREVDVKLAFMEKDKNSENKLKSITIHAGKKQLPVEAFTKFKKEKAWPQIRRRNKNTTLGVKITYADTNFMELSRKVSKIASSMHLPPGYSWDKGRRFKEVEETDNSTMYAAILAATFVLLLMGVLFESYILPFSIIISVPLAFIGSYWLIYITGTIFNPMAATGILILVGIVVNNGIVLIDHINRLRKQGMDRKEAIIQGSTDRLRPVLMTALTTIIGLIPLAIGRANLVGIPYSPLAITVIGGLTTSTFLTLFVVPTFYYLLDVTGEYFKNLTAAFFSKAKVEKQSL
ncbi:hydrophobic/amphiphilic exporter-1, HAE1 family [Thermotomaculum hydrothermale]|uniref:Hydrophobic/amphiphilic exporter-1, HAE1 family n=1 Tax=Thermotomaculum hydrothermale TaxID=981385 RepID=A0A7R6T072_9BACT|nr:efflux RND transporter permease subunit [Thermotomaculum hydrothermale]BBB33422.1 hydrophobic/amphiphilic exporter-1, HAE1 family [Thermotomaculum hydrothermale]